MKKSVIFLIGIIYIISIVVVTFFGLQPSIDQFQIYMNYISISNYDDIVRNQKYIYLEYDEIEGYSSVTIQYDYGPTNASYPDRVRFSLSGNVKLDEEGNEVIFATVNSYGEVVFSDTGTVRLTITTTDGSSLSDIVMIRCR